MRHMSHMEPDIDWDELCPTTQWYLNGSENRSTGQTPHKLLYGMELRQPWSLLQATQSQDFSSRYDAEQSLRLAAFMMKEQYDRGHQHISFEVGDYVYIRLFKGYNIAANAGLPKKIAQQYAGPFRVLARVGRLAYRLDLPASWNIHPVLSVAMLEPAPKISDPFNRDRNNAQPTHDERFPEDADRFNVERIMAKRVRRIGRARHEYTEYLVRWEGFDGSHDEWIRQEELDGAAEMIQQFEDRQRREDEAL